MIGFMESMYYYSLQGCLRVRAEVISLAEQTDVLLPSLIAEGLSTGSASCRRWSTTIGDQPAQRHAPGPNFDLGAECSAAGIDLGIRIPREYGSQFP